MHILQNVKTKTKMEVFTHIAHVSLLKFKILPLLKLPEVIKHLEPYAKTKKFWKQPAIKI